MADSHFMEGEDVDDVDDIFDDEEVEDEEVYFDTRSDPNHHRQQVSNSQENRGLDHGEVEDDDEEDDLFAEEEPGLEDSVDQDNNSANGNSHVNNNNTNGNKSGSGVIPSCLEEMEAMGLDESSIYRMKPLERDPSGNFFPCPLCSKTFNVKHTVYRHIKEVHRKVIIFLDSEGRELESNKPPPLFPCTLEGCREVFNTKRNLERHLRHHEQGHIGQHMTRPSASGSRPPLLHSYPDFDDGEGELPDGDEDGDPINHDEPHSPIPVETILEEEDDPDIGDRDGLDDGVADDIFEEEGEDDDFDDVDFREEDVFGNQNGQTGNGNGAMGIPYRCVYGACPAFFTTKSLLLQHLKTAHSVRMELVPFISPSTPTANKPQSTSSTLNKPPVTSTPAVNSAGQSSTQPLLLLMVNPLPSTTVNQNTPVTSTSNTESVTSNTNNTSNQNISTVTTSTSSPSKFNNQIGLENKRFPCKVKGCQSGFTRRDRLNQHIKLKHPGAPLCLAPPQQMIGQQGGSGHHLQSHSSSFRVSSQVGMSQKSVSMPPTLKRQVVSGGYSRSPMIGTMASPRRVLSFPPSGKTTIHPKKYACDVPGCGKSYTKGSHVKRHKLSAHPELFSGLKKGATTGTSYIKSAREQGEEEREDYDDDVEFMDGLDDFDDDITPPKKVKVSPQSQARVSNGAMMTRRLR